MLGVVIRGCRKEDTDRIRSVRFRKVRFWPKFLSDIPSDERGEERCTVSTGFPRIAVYLSGFLET
jgi:hypothetical protein